jgi:glutathione S-transferase
LEVDIFPTPRETLKSYGMIKDSRFRGKVKELGHKAMFPFMVDPNTGTSMYESAAIIDYLWETYGDAPSAPWFISSAGAVWNLVLLGLVTMFRPLFHFGILRVPSRAPERPLELWGAEGYVDSRPAQESLCSLELPYRYHLVPIGAPSAKWDALAAAGGSFWRLPLLVDPNEGHKKVSGGTAIAEYLEATYKTGEAVAESAADYSTAGASADHGTIPGSKGGKSA